MSYKGFTEEHYNHIKERGFRPDFCRECQEIDKVLMKMPQSYYALYEAGKMLVSQHGTSRAVVMAVKAIAKA